jgi:hypothetical protein
MSIEEHNWQKIINFDENFTSEALKFEDIRLGASGQRGRSLCFDDFIAFGSIFVQIPLSPTINEGFFLFLQSHETQLLDKIILFGKQMQQEFNNVNEMQPLLRFFSGDDAKTMQNYKDIFAEYQEYWNDVADERIIDTQTLTEQQVRIMEEIYSQCYFSNNPFGEESKIQELSKPHIFDFNYFFNNYTKTCISEKEIEVQINKINKDYTQEHPRIVTNTFPPTKIPINVESENPDYTVSHSVTGMSHFKWFTSSDSPAADSGTINFFVSSNTVITVYGLQIHWDINEDNEIVEHSFETIKKTFQRLKGDIEETLRESCTIMRIFRCAVVSKSENSIFGNKLDIKVKKDAFHAENDQIIMYKPGNPIPILSMTWTFFDSKQHLIREPFHCRFGLYDDQNEIKMRICDLCHIETFLNRSQPRKKQSKRRRRTITVTALPQKFCKKCMVVD